MAVVLLSLLRLHREKYLKGDSFPFDRECHASAAAPSRKGRGCLGTTDQPTMGTAAVGFYLPESMHAQARHRAQRIMILKLVSQHEMKKELAKRIARIDKHKSKFCELLRYKERSDGSMSNGMSNRQTGTKATISYDKNTNKTVLLLRKGSAGLSNTHIQGGKAMDKQKLHELRVFAAKSNLETLGDRVARLQP